MPSEKHDLIRLQMNALGVIDFDKGSISLDAVLYDSRLAGKFPITGSMAMRLSWGTPKVFALSIGGFHPAFKPPPQFPALERLAISFADTADFRLRARVLLRDHVEHVAVRRQGGAVRARRQASALRGCSATTS